MRRPGATNGHSTQAPYFAQVLPASQPTPYVDLERDDSLSAVFGTSNVPEQFDYICLEEYVVLRKAMEKIGVREDETIGVVITGQAGIGKTAFLLYLLLHRLERKLPTAVQLGSVLEGLTWDCDVGIAVNKSPTFCQPLVRVWESHNLRTVLVKDDVVIRMVEAAGRKELKFQPSSAFLPVIKRGPSIRTTIELVQTPNLEADERRLTAAPQSDQQNSGILFIRPYRPKGLVDLKSSQLFTFAIPTHHLGRIFEQHSAVLSNEKLLKVLDTLSLHSLTRSAAGWGHEMAMHRKMCSPRALLAISRSVSTHQDDPVTETSKYLVTGTPGCLVLHAGLMFRVPKFYWTSSVVDLPGVDGVLGDDDGHVNILQAAIADEADYRSPVKGLEAIFAMLGAWEFQPYHPGGSCRCRFVIFADDKPTADRLLERFQVELEGVEYLGKKISVEVWACVLSKAYDGRRKDWET
ncbi:hypothetical protein FA15DRAFT_707309 [Coprinopsis marcescibilis]|uniref:Uncharacterized protein n=1 Tax=Coprinopsis marcescibilis TaxID=230819 RepID=A0A5C3KZG9_COPMA|nr:hypothetical protein FA15DRAFT_707309 [Coprinopsis marcescibilis]